MNQREQKILLLGVGLGLVVFGHRLMEAELGQLGLPHVVGGLLVTAALQS
jgi:hypothetical protein